MNIAESVGLARTKAEPAFVVVSKEFGFVSGHVHVDRAFAFATFAREAEVERFLDRFAAPAVLQDFAAKHFEEQAGSAASGVHFLTGGLVTRTHRAGLVAPAFANADAALHRLCKTETIAAVVEVSF